MKNIFFLLALAASSFFIAGCGSDDDGMTTPDFCALNTYSERSLEALNAFSAAAGVYGNDPTTANCEAYRSAGQDYLDVLEEYNGCAVIADRQDYREGIAEAQAELDAIVC